MTTKPLDDVYGKPPLLVRLRPYLIIAPALLLTIGIIIPFLTAIYYSLTNLSLQRPTYSFVWFRNWQKMFLSASFWHAVWVTLKYAFFTSASEIGLGLLIGILVSQRDNWFSRTLKVALVFPLMVAPVIATVIWQLMTNTSVGILEKFLNLFGIYGFPWAASGDTALFTVVLIDIWVYTPFVIVLIVAGFNSLPKSPFEAAMIDGGSAWFTFKNLTLPMIKPFLYIAVIFRLMASMQEYAIIYALTRGGPGDTLMNLSLTAYDKGFPHMRLGEAMPYVLTLWAMIYFISQKMVVRWLDVQKTASGKD